MLSDRQTHFCNFSTRKCSNYDFQFIFLGSGTRSYLRSGQDLFRISAWDNWNPSIHRRVRNFLGLLCIEEIGFHQDPKHLYQKQSSKFFQFPIERRVERLDIFSSVTELGVPKGFYMQQRLNYQNFPMPIFSHLLLPRLKMAEIWIFLSRNDLKNHENSLEQIILDLLWIISREKICLLDYFDGLHLFKIVYDRV